MNLDEGVDETSLEHLLGPVGFSPVVAARPGFAMRDRLAVRRLCFRNRAGNLHLVRYWIPSNERRWRYSF